mgnify:CR=1 FL=1|jgi:hypothetical protein
MRTTIWITAVVLALVIIDGATNGLRFTSRAILEISKLGQEINRAIVRNVQ